MKLQGMTAIVTGGASGLGAATATALAAAGARVAILDLDANAAIAQAARFGGVGTGCDVTDSDSAVTAIERVKAEYGPARILVCCAGIAPAGRIIGRNGPMPLASFRRVIDVNLLGSFNVLRLAAADMAGMEPLEDGERGLVLLTASIAAYEGQIGQTAYAASKAAVAGLVLPAARELAAVGIRVNAIAPGVFETPMVAAMPEEVKASLCAGVPFPSRFGRAEEFAALALHIVENRMINGTVLRLDGANRMAPR
jgi:NAD(P)-dependent dehydrogenase (short-subunit alcohol dehydrogenase family)